MAEEITYYAIIDDLSSLEHPAGVLRRIKHMAANATRPSVPTSRGRAAHCFTNTSTAT